MEIVQDRGVLRGSKKGAFAIGGSDQRSSHLSGDSDDHNDHDASSESEDELSRIDPLPSLPSHAFLEARKAQQADRDHLLQFTLMESKARAMRASTAGEGNDVDEEWEEKRRALERGSGNELLPLAQVEGALGRITEEAEEEEEDDFALFEVTPTIPQGRVLPKTAGALAARSGSVKPAPSSAVKGKGKARSGTAPPPSTTRAIRKAVEGVSLDSSSPSESRALGGGRMTRSASVRPGMMMIDSQVRDTLIFLLQSAS